MSVYLDRELECSAAKAFFLPLIEYLRRHSGKSAGPGIPLFRKGIPMYHGLSPGLCQPVPLTS